MARFGSHTYLILGLVAFAVQATAQAQQDGLHSLAVGAGKLFFGTATDTNLFNDSAYLAIANDRNEFGLHTPENSQKWQPTEPTEGKFTFTNPDAVARAAVTNGQILRCHTLTWHSQLPSFVTTTNWTREALTAAIQAHISNVVGHFKGQCYSWDVVNEALNENGTIRQDVFFNTLGTDYLAISFRAAAAADPDAKLYYNDFNLETNKAKADGAVKIVQLLQQAGVRIDGVGFQAHMTVGVTPPQANLVAVFNRFTALGLEVALTELDIAHRTLPASTTAVEQQAKDYVTMVGACLAVSKCVGVVAWEFTDKYSWIPQSFPGEGDACLFDAHFNRKPAYTSVSSLLAAAATRAATAKGAGAGAGMYSNSSTKTTTAGAGPVPTSTVTNGLLQPSTSGVPISAAGHAAMGGGMWLISGSALALLWLAL